MHGHPVIIITFVTSIATLVITAGGAGRGAGNQRRGGGLKLKR